MRALAQSLPKPRPSIHINEDVCALLAINPFAYETILSYERLRQAAGPFSGLSKRLTELLPDLQPERTLLVIRTIPIQQGNHFFGRQDFTIESILHCQHMTTNCECF